MKLIGPAIICGCTTLDNSFTFQRLTNFSIILYDGRKQRTPFGTIYIWIYKKKINFYIYTILSWKIQSKSFEKISDFARPHVDDSKACSLCLNEKFHIITSKKKLLNKRSELVSTCRHVNKFLLKNYKVVPPDVS